ncbi:MAG TPA: VWA domain-containing protein [Candidatus Omnitrophota bacterium]|nr:VWA domain-containing protein [Candidatus Omnitrophota bacterium]HPT06605.1 VWA domain-containing protein [Candidatus Omnitrophota bacterium]
MIIHSPIFLLLIPFAVAFVLYAQIKTRSAGIRFSSGTIVEGIKPTLTMRLRQYVFVVRIIALILLIIALARPQSPVEDSKIETEGIDIVLAIDSSTSMLAEDFTIGGKRMSRVEVVLDVVKDFIKGRQSDRIGLVTFAARAYTVCPLTRDYGWLQTNLQRIRAGMLEDGTALGSGIAASLNRLKNSKAKSKIIILLTDGRNNTGSISPRTAAEAARALRVKIYTIGAGAQGLVPFPVRDFWGNKAYQQVELDLDENSLREISSVTGGKFFRATDTETLRKIYGEIDRLEKTPLEDKSYQEYQELFPGFLAVGLVFLLFEIIVSQTILRTIP